MADSCRRANDVALFEDADYVLEVIELLLAVGDKNQPYQKLSPSIPMPATSMAAESTRAKSTGATSVPMPMTPALFVGVRAIGGSLTDNYLEFRDLAAPNDLQRILATRVERRKRLEERSVIRYIPAIQGYDDIAHQQTGTNRRTVRFDPYHE